MLPKKEYMKLSRAEKQAVKKSLGLDIKKRKPAAKARRAPRKSLLGKAGRYLGSMVPYVPKVAADAGEYLGNKLSHGISSVFGHGDYVLSTFNISNNTLLNPGDTPPQFGSTLNDRITRVKHREYIADVFSSTTFSINGYYINPGLGSTFPWLSSVAGNFECYRIKGMLFEFKSMSSDALNSTNTALGSIIMATQYNAADAAFVSKQQMENYEFAQSCKPSQSMLHYIECSRGYNPLTELYVRTGTIPANQTQQVYDIGELFIATTGMQASNVNLGELWVTYDIELLKPKLIQGQYGYEINYYDANFGGSMSTSDYFAGATYSSANNMSITLDTSGIITFPTALVVGTYLVQYYMICTSSAPSPVTIAATSNCTANTIFLNNANSQVSATNSSAYYCVTSKIIDITGPGPVLTISGGTWGTGILTGQLIITQLNGLAN